MNQIPRNGIYIMFETGESGHGGQRIVRVGTHTGVGQLQSRMRQHFLNPNKDRSIFRKNIGRALLSRDDEPFLEQWELDLTTRKAREKYSSIVDFDKQAQVEKRVTEYIQANFSFVCFRVDDKALRMELEKRIISTISWCEDCGPSAEWLGLHSPKDKIRRSGLWLEQGLYKEPLSEAEFETTKSLFIVGQSGRGYLQ